MKRLTAEEFETMVDRIVEESPRITQGEAAIALYRAQENFNKEEQTKNRKEYEDFLKKCSKLRGIKL